MFGDDDEAKKKFLCRTRGPAVCPGFSVAPLAPPDQSLTQCMHGHAHTRIEKKKKTLGGPWWSPSSSTTDGGEVHAAAAAAIVTPASRRAPTTGAGTPSPPICHSAVASAMTTTGKTHAIRKENVGTLFNFPSGASWKWYRTKKRHGVDTPSLVLGWGFLELRRVPRRARPSERPQNDVLCKH